MHGGRLLHPESTKLPSGNPVTTPPWRGVRAKQQTEEDVTPGLREVNSPVTDWRENTSFLKITSLRLAHPVACIQDGGAKALRRVTPGRVKAEAGASLSLPL